VSKLKNTTLMWLPVPGEFTYFAFINFKKLKG